MTKVKEGDQIEVHYKGTLNDGTIFDSSEGRMPLSFKVGAGHVIEGFDKGVKGMVVGEKKNIHIPCLQAYGEYNEQMLIQMPKERLPVGMNPLVGDQLQLTDQQGQIVSVSVKEITETTLVLDANHSLAGKDLNFELELVKIN